uniref:Uncharacterized protein n=1 Tax=Setaria italica TaxID=4555 RepID=K3YFI4_SETIT
MRRTILQHDVEVCCFLFIFSILSSLHFSKRLMFM